MEKVLHFFTGVWRSCKDIRPPPRLICRFNVASNTPQRKLDTSEVHPGEMSIGRAKDSLEREATGLPPSYLEQQELER